MRFDVHIHIHNYADDESKRLLLTIKNQLNIMAKTQQELTQEVKDLTLKVNKVGTETRKLLTKIEELTDAIANGGPVAPELQAAVDDLKIQVNVVDELVPDAPAEPPVEE